MRCTKSFICRSSYPGLLAETELRGSSGGKLRGAQVPGLSISWKSGDKTFECGRRAKCGWSSVWRSARWRPRWPKLNLALEIRARAEAIGKLKIIQHGIEQLQQTVLPLHGVFIPASLREFVYAPGHFGNSIAVARIRAAIGASNISWDTCTQS